MLLWFPSKLPSDFRTSAQAELAKVKSMDAKEAIARAKAYVMEVFSGEGISNLGLEEIFFDDASNSWDVTVGFSRPWDIVGNNAITSLVGNTSSRRSYKTLRISNDGGAILFLKNRATA